MADVLAAHTAAPEGSLRRAVLCAGVCGQLSAALAGVLPVLALPASLLLLVVLSRLAPRSAALRPVGTGLALVAVLVALPGLVGASAWDLRTVLGPLLVAIQLAQALMWQTRRDVQTGLVVAVGLLVLGASFAPDLVVGLPLVAGWVACVVATAVLVSLRTTDAVDAVAVASHPPVRGRVLTATALALALGLVAFLLVPVPQSPGLQSRLARASGAAAASTGSARATTYSSDTIDTSARGELSDRPIAEVPVDSPELWRSRTYDTWDGRTWSTPTRASRPVAPPYVVSELPAGRTDRVRLLAPDGTLWSPGQPVSVADLNLPPLLVGDDGELRARRDTTDYAVTTAAQDASPATLRGDVMGAAAAGYLQLPAELPPRVRDLARQITAGSLTTYDRVRAVETWLGANATYRLDSPVPGPGEDAVDRFLFADRVGFCEQFAAAETVLLRSVGIPARFTVGLAYGIPAGAQRRSYREKDLHAWVEVAYAEAGWVASDPTAGAAQAAAKGHGLRARVAAILRAALAATERFPAGRPGLAVLLLGLVAGAWLVRRRTSARPAPEPVVQPSAGAGTALAAFLRLDGRLATGRRRPAESLAEMRARLGLTGDAALAFGALSQECYAAAGPAPVDARQAVEVLDALGPGPG